ncbi:MAG: Hpt domain-containing protein [Pseudomonadota bacterium]
MALRTATAAIDLGHLEQYTTGDEALLGEILTLFCEQVERCLLSLNPTTDDTAWRDACHSLKGAARGVGAWKLGDLAAEGEALIGDIEGVHEARPAQLKKIREGAADAIECAIALCQRPG